MFKNVLKAAVAVTALMVAGCDIIVQSPTTVKAENDMTDLLVEIDGVENDVSGIDLYNVEIGDITWSAIYAGTVTTAEETTSSGSTIISIGSATATVLVSVLGTLTEQEVDFSDIDDMLTDIATGTVNTVVFDENTAANLL